MPHQNGDHKLVHAGIAQPRHAGRTKVVATEGLNASRFNRMTALVLVVPLAWVPDRTFAPPSPFFATVLTTIAAPIFSTGR